MASQRPRTAPERHDAVPTIENHQQASAASTKQRKPRSPRRPDDKRRVRKRPQKPVADKVRLRMTPEQRAYFIKLCARLTNDGDITQRNAITPPQFEWISDKLKRRYPNQNFSGHKLEYAFKQLRIRWRTYCRLVKGESVPHDELGIPMLPEKVWTAFLKKHPKDNWLRRESVGDILQLGNIFWHGVPTGVFCREAGDEDDIPDDSDDSSWPPMTEAEYWALLRDEGSSDDESDSSETSTFDAPSTSGVSTARFDAMLEESARRVNQVPDMDDLKQAINTFNNEMKDDWPRSTLFEVYKVLGEGKGCGNSCVFNALEGNEARRQFLEAMMWKPEIQEQAPGQAA